MSAVGKVLGAVVHTTQQRYVIQLHLADIDVWETVAMNRTLKDAIQTAEVRTSITGGVYRVVDTAVGDQS